MAVNEKKNAEPEIEEETPSGVLVPPKPGQELFDGKAKTLRVTKDVNVAQLLNEVDARLNDVERFQVVAHLEDDDNPVSEENPLTLHIAGDPDMRTVRGVVDSHEKDDSYGLTEEEKDISDLREKLRSGKDLPAAELNRLLRSIL